LELLGFVPANCRKSEPPMNAIVFQLVAARLYAANTWHLL
jgi:hypothetical protein